MKEIGTKTKNMVMASISIKMEMFTREDGGMIIGMEMESWLTAMEHPIVDNGKKESSMALEPLFLLKVTITKVNGKVERCMVKEF